MFEKHFGCCRWLYNYALSKKKEVWDNEKRFLSRYDLQAELPGLKKSENTKWLNEVNAQSLQATLLILDKAYKKFLNFEGGSPHFKKKTNNQSFSCPQRTKISFEKSTISITKIKKIPIVLTRRFDGKIKTVTITKTSTGKYFASILVDNEVGFPEKAPITNNAIGIDLGITHFAILDNGTKFDNPRFLQASLDQLKVLQRRASRKKKGSGNRKKANLRVAVIHEKIRNQRTDFLQKLSTKIVCDNQTTICIESLAVKNMVKNHSLAKAISDASWSEFVRQIQYKCDWSGKNLIKIGRFEASTKTCFGCGFVLSELPLNVREWICEGCGALHDRDINAAKNIRSMGLSGRAPSVGPVEMSTMVESMKQETLN